MTTTLCIVDVPTRQGGRASLAGRRFGDTTLLEWVVRRVTESLLVEQIAIIGAPEEEATLQRLVPPDVVISTGHHEDYLAHMVAVTRQADASVVVRVSIERPFVDPVLIDRLVCDCNVHPGIDYVGYVVEDGRSALQAKLGVFAELYRAQAVFDAERRAAEPADRLDITRFICSRPEMFQLRLLQAPPRLDRRDIRLSIDTEEDWEHANLIIDALSPERLDWQGIAELLIHQPELRRRMEVLNDADAKLAHS